MVGRSRLHRTRRMARGITATGISVVVASALAVAPAGAQPTGELSSGSLSGSAGGGGSAGSSGSGDGPVDPGPVDPGPVDPGPVDPGPGQPEGPYEGSVEVVSGPAADPQTLTGRVFDDANRNSQLDEGEAGVAGVSVSNGVDVVETDAQGVYSLPVRGNFTAFVTQPAGWQVPVDQNNFAQFSFNHYPEGSPTLRFPGVAPTGDLPAAVNFPLAPWRDTAADEQSCVFAADTQPKNLAEVGYARNGVVADLAAREDYSSCGVLLLGDNVENDLSLNEAVKELYSEMNGPVRALPGNHDMNFDSPGYENSVDTFRRDFGAPYFSYDVGQTHIVALFNLRYNGVTAGGAYGGYVETIPEEQLEWLRNDLATVDRSKHIVVASHAPLVNYRGVVTQNAAALYEILAPFANAVTVSGHMHTVENLVAGEVRPAWTEAGIPRLPVDQIVAGAVSGSWNAGALNENGLPYAYTPEGAEPGVLTMRFDGTNRSEFYTARNQPQTKQTLTGIYSYSWDDWARAAKAWRDAGAAAPAPEEFDTSTLTLADVQTGRSTISTSFYGGSTRANVEFSINGEPSAPGFLNQPAGDPLKVGWQHAEVVSTTHHLVHGGTLFYSSPHLYRYAIPEDLEVGTHTVTITATDRYGVVSTETFEFTVLPTPEAPATPQARQARQAPDGPQPTPDLSPEDGPQSQP